MTVNPDVGLSAPDTLHPEGLYAFRFDLNGDAREEVTFEFRFGEPRHGDGSEHTHIQPFVVRKATGDDAFQLGYLMAVLTHVEMTLPSGATYEDRLTATSFMSQLYLHGLNAFFAANATRHRTLVGYVAEPRARAFEANEKGFRGLLAARNVRELNEKQWEFFRYMIMEIIHSRLASDSVLATLNAPEHAAHAASFRTHLETVLADLHKLRLKYFEAAVETALKTPDFRREVDMLEMKAANEGKSEDEIKLLVRQAAAQKRTEITGVCNEHLRASLGRLESARQVLKRLGGAVASSEGEGSGADQDEGGGVLEQDDLENAVAIDNLQRRATDDSAAYRTPAVN